MRYKIRVVTIELLDVDVGLEQGCVLSPLLVNTYVNDLIHAT